MRPIYKLLFVISSLAIINTFIYITFAGGIGFPLDDAWIHQVYARNIGTLGEMSFNPGQLSSGSTAPAWTMLLSLSYLMGIHPILWAYFWGVFFAIGTALVSIKLSKRYFGAKSSDWLVGIICILEWHMAWAALSGMEISLFTFLTLIYLWLLDRGTHPSVFGLLAGLLFWVRPEGLLLAALYSIPWLCLRPNYRKMIESAVIFIFSFSVIVGPLIIFNNRMGSSIFPNTVYAKYMQFGYPWSLYKTGKYYIELMLFFIRGPLMLLIPLVAITVYQLQKKIKIRITYPLIWAFALVIPQSVALPQIYHNGRYLIPIIPLVIIFGLAGLDWMSNRFNQWKFFWLTYKVLIVVMVIVLSVNGVSTFSLLNRLLETQHGEIGQWINIHTPPGTIIATHDIGLIGYYSHRTIVDLAGLITPEVIPFLHDQYGMAEICKRYKVEYLAVFTPSYETLLRELDAYLVFSPSSAGELRKMGLVPIELWAVPSQVNVTNYYSKTLVTPK